MTLLWPVRFIRNWRAAMFSPIFISTSRAFRPHTPPGANLYGLVIVSLACLLTLTSWLCSEPSYGRDEDQSLSIAGCTAAQPRSASSPFTVTTGCPRSSVARGDGCRYPVKLGEGILRQVEVGRRGVLLQPTHLLRA